MKTLALLLTLMLLPLQVMAYQADTPLMVVRFYHGDVNYRQPLFQAMAQAMKVSPDLRFNVIAVSPENSDGALADKYSRQVANDMVSIGMPSDKISITQSREGGLPGPEVRIFVNR